MSTTPTRGRMTGETQAAAITRVVALSPQRKVILEALDRVTSSPAFQSSKRAQSFLRHIVEHALAGELDHLKERCIGSTLFERRADYNTGSDSIVRVTANEVRKRLAAYYAQSAPADPVTFDLPLGSYIPEIQLETVDARTPGPPVAAPDPQPRAVLPWRTIAIAGWGLAIVIGFLWVRGPASAPAPAQAKLLQILPWVAIFEGGQTPKLVLADSSMGMLRVFYPMPASIEEYADRRFLTPPAGLRPEFVEPWGKIALKSLTSLADARIAAGYAPLAVASGHRPVVVSARNVTLSDFRHGDNLILLGSSSANPWVELFQEQIDFHLRFSPDRANQVEIRHRTAGDPEHLVSDVTSGATGDAYATLSLVNGLDGRGKVLIVQGTNMEGTDLAGELAMNPDSLTDALHRCGIDPANPAGRFEILLKLKSTAGSARSSSVLATHCHAGK